MPKFMSKAIRLIVMVGLVFFLAGCKEVLFARLAESQANEVMAALAEAGLPASKSAVEENLWQIQVDEAQLGRAAALLQAQGIPQNRHVSMGDVFKKDGLIPSASEERIRYVHSLSEELGVTIRKIPGVLDARVHVVIPHNDPLASRIIPSSASVFVKHRIGVDAAVIGPNIKDLIAASVEGLEMKNVALFSYPVAAPSVEARPAAKVGSSKGALVSQQDSDLAPYFLGGLMAAGVFAWRWPRSDRTPRVSGRGRWRWWPARKR
jgi:type III secretion protein J